MFTLIIMTKDPAFNLEVMAILINSINVTLPVGRGELLNHIVSMIKETRYNGLFDVEFIQDKDGINYFLEVNFRVDGSIYKLAPGINLPLEWGKLVELKENHQPLPVVLKLGKNNFTGMSECDDFRENVLTGKLNPLVWMVQFFKADKHIVRAQAKQWA